MKKSKISNVILILLLLMGLSLLLYPSFSNYWNALHQTKAIAKYHDAVANLQQEDYTRLWNEALEYNRLLQERENEFALPESLEAVYDQRLDMGGGVMGYIEIPSIRVNLPIYHGTGDRVLQSGVGHLEWSSLPTGGPGTHCLLSGHRGLPSAKLFTDLDQIREGDLFLVRTLDELLTYQVDQIRTVKPNDVTTLTAEPGKDLCTLITCTPYGINSHRLLIRGHRVENTDQTATVRVTADALRIDPLPVAAGIFGPILIVLLVLTRGFDKKRPEKNDA